MYIIGSKIATDETIKVGDKERTKQRVLADATRNEQIGDITRVSTQHRDRASVTLRWSQFGAVFSKPARYLYVFSIRTTTRKTEEESPSRPILQLSPYYYLYLSRSLPLSLSLSTLAEFMPCRVC